MPITSKNAARDKQIYIKSRVYGWTQERIAEHFNLSQPRVSEIITDQERRNLTPDAAELRQLSYEALAEIKRRQLEISELVPAPVTAGKDGDVVTDPETGQVVRDYGGQLKALADAAKTDDMIAKRFGLDAPQKVQTDARVRYEVVGLDESDLS